MSPLWGFGCLVYAAFYKHAAPLGLNAEPNSPPRQCWSWWGGVSVFNPCNLIRNRDDARITVNLFTCRPSGALVVWYAAFL